MIRPCQPANQLSQGTWSIITETEKGEGDCLVDLHGVGQSPQNQSGADQLKLGRLTRSDSRILALLSIAECEDGRVVTEMAP